MEMRVEKRVDARGGFNPMTSSAGDDLDPIFHSLLSSGLPRYFRSPDISPITTDRPIVRTYVRTLCVTFTTSSISPSLLPNAFSRFQRSPPLSLVRILLLLPDDDETNERTETIRYRGYRNESRETLAEFSKKIIGKCDE